MSTRLSKIIKESMVEVVDSAASPLFEGLGVWRVRRFASRYCFVQYSRNVHRGVLTCAASPLPTIWGNIPYIFWIASSA